ncbi:hypothetical protein OG474_30135 [Kribbella sp. NBC_01505]|uniref:hypothetical protein n=1 Tax=Kribbella sp. NBC_01505 TaxID=2903580 RepID=UPI0038708A05
MRVIFVAVDLLDYEVGWNVAANSAAERDEALKAHAVGEWSADPESEDWSVIEDPIQTEDEALARYREILNAMEETSGRCIITSRMTLADEVSA